MKFYFMKGKNATQAAKKIGAVYGADSVSDRIVVNGSIDFALEISTSKTHLVLAGQHVKRSIKLFRRWRKTGI